MAYSWAWACAVGVAVGEGFAAVVLPHAASISKGTPTTTRQIGYASDTSFSLQISTGQRGTIRRMLPGASFLKGGRPVRLLVGGPFPVLASPTVSRRSE